MKCEVCEKELTPENESEHKGVCKECNAEIMGKINRKKEVVASLAEEKEEYKQVSYTPKYTQHTNTVADFLKILMWIIIGLGILVFVVFCITAFDESSGEWFLDGFIAAIYFCTFAIIVRATAEIIQLLEDIKNK